LINTSAVGHETQQQRHAGIGDFFKDLATTAKELFLELRRNRVEVEMYHTEKKTTV